MIFKIFCQKNGFFDQIYGTNLGKKNNQKMFIFRSQNLLRPQLRFRNRFMAIA